jgi:CubicO group peptidase (beta-lactamase class C family)
MLHKKRLVSVLVFSLIAMTAFAGQSRKEEAKVELPKTAAGQSVQAFIEALNSGEVGQLERFFAAHISAEAAKQAPPADRAARVMQLHREMGIMKLRKAESPSPESVVIYVSGEGNQLMRVGFQFSPAPEYFLTGITVDEADPEDLAGSPQPMSGPEALAALEKEIAAAAAADEVSGVVLVAHQGRPLFLKAWGLANKEFNVPNRTDTKFNLGSINKIFTKLAVAQLIEKGKLSPDDKLGTVLPEYPNAEAKAKVTIRQLIDMKSGVGDFFGDRFVATPKDVFRRNVDFLPMFADQPLAFEPGAQQSYSNGGYIVLGEIVGRVSGMDYYDYVRKNIYEPAGMTNTDSYEADVSVPNLAEGYTRRWDGNENPGSPRRKNIYSRPARGSAAGGGYTTAEDLLRFTNALVADKLLSPAYTEWQLTGVEPSLSQKTPAGPRVRGGLGVAGGAPGINAALEMDRETGYTIIVLGNYDPPAAVNIAKKARRLIGAIKK